VNAFLGVLSSTSVTLKLGSVGNMRMARFQTFCFTLAIGIFACSQMAEAQNLEDVLAQTYATNPTIKAARAELRSVNEGVPQALSNWRPSAALSASAGKVHNDTEGGLTFSGDQNTTPTEVVASIVQPLYRGGRTTAATSRAENDVRAQRALLRSIEQTVLLTATTAYMDVWRDQAILELNVSNENVIAQQLLATRDRFVVGEVTRTDIAQAETRLAAAQAERIAAEGNLLTSKAVYRQVIGQEAGQLFAPPGVIDLPSGLNEAIDESFENNPELEAAVISELSARAGVEEVFGELLPTIQLNGSLRHGEETFQRDSEVDEAALLLEVRVPLYQSGAVSSRVRQAKQIANQRRIEIEENRRETEQETISSWQALESARAQIRSYEAGVRSAEIALDGVREESAVGERTILDILDAEQELLDAKVNLVVSQRDQMVASHQLLSSVGRLTARDLGLPVDLYDPTLDYQRIRDTWFDLSAPGVIAE
jgi:TolC family type I secretion outer membrane protein